MKINRKHFLKLGGAAALSLAGLTPLAAACGGIRRSDIVYDPDAERIKRKLGEERYRILYLASLAPSAHNIQPWSVRILSRDRWIVGVDPARRMKATDPENLLVMLSMGTFIEHLSLAAGALGFDVKIRVITDDFHARDCATVELKKATPRPYPLERITRRKTIKNGFLDRPLEEGHLAELRAPLEGHFFYFPHKSTHGTCVGDGAVESFQAWLNSKEAQAEHVQWLRIGRKKAEAHRDGLTTEGMEIKGASGLMVRTFFSEEDFAGSFMKKESMKFTRKTAREGAGYAIITGYGRDVAGIIETGRRFARMALVAVDYNIAVQPMSQMLEMASGRNTIRSNHRPGVDPQMILRLGYIKSYPEPVSLRRPVSWFVKGAEVAQ